MKTITVILKGNLKHYSSAGAELTVDLDDDQGMPELLAALGLAPGQVGLAVAGGQIIPLDARLPDGCRLELYEMFAGG